MGHLSVVRSTERGSFVMSKFGYFAAGFLVATIGFWGKVLIFPVTSDAVIMAPTRLLHEQAPRDLPIVKGDLS